MANHQFTDLLKFKSVPHSTITYPIASITILVNKYVIKWKTAERVTKMVSEIYLSPIVISKWTS